MSDRRIARHRVAGHAAQAPPAPPPTGRQALRAAAGIACGLYAGALLLLWGVIRWSPPGSWPADLFLFGPRWAASLPLLPLTLLAARLRLGRPGLGLALASATLPGICGFNVPWPGPSPRGERISSGLRLLTCNVQGPDLRASVLAGFVRETRPDVVLLQESSPVDPAEILSGGGWHVRREGEFCLASRYPIAGFEALRRPDDPYRVIAVRARVLRPEGAVQVVAVHLMTPREGLEALIDSPLAGLGSFRTVSALQRYESRLVRDWVGDCPDPVLVAGDFNVTAEHPSYRRDWAGYTNAFSATRWGLGYTMFTRLVRLRIDHVLAGASWRAERCRVGPEVGSAHRPVIAEFARLVPSPPSRRAAVLRPGTDCDSSRLLRAPRSVARGRSGAICEVYAGFSPTPPAPRSPPPATPSTSTAGRPGPPRASGGAASPGISVTPVSWPPAGRRTAAVDCKPAAGRRCGHDPRGTDPEPLRHRVAGRHFFSNPPADTPPGPRTAGDLLHPLGDPGAEGRRPGIAAR